MSQPRMSLRPFLLKSIAVSLLVTGAHIAGTAEGGHKPTPSATLLYRSPLPLGAEGFELKPANRVFFLLASADCPKLDKLQVNRAQLGGTVMAADGSRLRHYPAELSFRVTATGIDPDMITGQLEHVESGGDLNSFLLGLKFRLKVYRALKMAILPPERIHLVGMPADVPFDERVYRVTFDATDIPVDARLVLEVMAPDGQRLSRFHLELL